MILYIYIYARAYVFAIKRLNDPFSLIFARLIRFLLKRKKRKREPSQVSSLPLPFSTEKSKVITLNRGTSCYFDPDSRIFDQIPVTEESVLFLTFSSFHFFKYQTFIFLLVVFLVFMIFKYFLNTLSRSRLFLSEIESAFAMGSSGCSRRAVSRLLFLQSRI